MNACRVLLLTILLPNIQIRLVQCCIECFVCHGSFTYTLSTIYESGINEKSAKSCVLNLRIHNCIARKWQFSGKKRLFVFCSFAKQAILLLSSLLSQWQTSSQKVNDKKIANKPEFNSNSNKTNSDFFFPSSCFF